MAPGSGACKFTFRHLRQGRRLEKAAAQNGTCRSDVPEDRLEAGKAPARRLALPGKPSRVLLNRMFGIPVTRLSTKASLKRGIPGSAARLAGAFFQSPRWALPNRGGLAFNDCSLSSRDIPMRSVVGFLFNERGGEAWLGQDGC